MSDPDTSHTRIVRRSSAGRGGQEGAPPPPAPAHFDPDQTRYVDGPSRGSGGDGSGTRIVTRDTPPPPPPPQEGNTILVRPSSRSRNTEADSPGGGPAADEFPADGPVVGWLVIVKGPGRGRSVNLGYGMNSVGREPDNRVPLPFGDALISRRKHAVITYDPRGRKFYIQQGESSNLTYVGDTPVLAPTLLEGGESISMGETELRFVPLCGAEFDWDSKEA
jgi:hypothetical protein